MLEGFAEALEMDETLTKDSQQAEQKSETAVARRFEPEEFDADTTEERPVALWWKDAGSFWRG